MYISKCPFDTYHNMTKMYILVFKFNKIYEYLIDLQDLKQTLNKTLNKYKP